MQMKLKLILIALGVLGTVAGADSRPRVETQLSQVLESNLMPADSGDLLYVSSLEWQGLVRLEADLTDYRGTNEALEKIVTELKVLKGMEVSGGRVGRRFQISIRAPLLSVTSEGVLAFEEAIAKALRRSSGSQLFHPARASYLVMGPPLAEMDTDPATGIDFRLLDHRAAVERAHTIMGTPTHCDLKLSRKITIF